MRVLGSTKEEKSATRSASKSPLLSAVANTRQPRRAREIDQPALWRAGHRPVHALRNGSLRREPCGQTYDALGQSGRARAIGQDRVQELRRKAATRTAQLGLSESSLGADADATRETHGTAAAFAQPGRSNR